MGSQLSTRIKMSETMRTTKVFPTTQIIKSREGCQQGVGLSAVRFSGFYHNQGFIITDSLDSLSNYNTVFISSFVRIGLRKYLYPDAS